MRGNSTDWQAEQDLLAIQAQIAGMGLPPNLDHQLSYQIDQILKQVIEANSPRACALIDEFTSIVTTKAAKKKPDISAAQAASLTQAMAHVRSEYGC